MKETRGDTAQAIVLAVAVHLALFLLLFAGLWWTEQGAPAAAGAISAELMDASDLPASMQRALQQRPEPIEPEPVPEEPEPEEPEPEPLPEPVEEQPQPQDFIPVPDDVDQAEVTEQPTPTPAKEDQVQEARQRQAQVDLTEQQRQQEAQRQERLTEMERQRQKQLEDIRRRRAAAAREADLAEQRLQQLANARSRNAAEAAVQSDAAATASGAGGVDEGLVARYRAAIQAAVMAKWTRPDSVPLGARCKLIIRQLPGGQVMSAEVTSPCAYDEQGRRSIEAAVLKAQPLPYAGFESVFNRQLNMNFEAQDR
jgi:colicin import membrane protein